MEDLIIHSANETPSVHLSASKGTFTFQGKSYPENVHDFYSQIFEYIDKYLIAPPPNTSLEFDWLYYNTATSKIIVKLILELKKSSGKGSRFSVQWHCSKDDELMTEKGEELKEILGVPFEIIYRS